jgi:Domain of unknown function (DUF4276)
VYGIIGEDNSDAQTLKVIVRRLAQNANLTIKAQGFDGCSEMLRKGASRLRLFSDLGLQRFIVCYDSDGHDHRERREEVMRRIVRPSGLPQPCCVLIPIEEIEAWILADIQAVSKVFSSWNPDPIRQNPESIPNPKEYLENLSKQTNKKPVYSHATYNQRVAEHLNLELVHQRCSSFRPLRDFVRQ